MTKVLDFIDAHRRRDSRLIMVGDMVEWRNFDGSLYVLEIKEFILDQKPYNADFILAEDLPLYTIVSVEDLRITGGCITQKLPHNAARNRMRFAARVRAG